MDCKGAVLCGVRSGFECLLSGVDRRRLACHLHRLQACWVKGMDKWERWARVVGLMVGVDGLLVCICWRVGKLAILDLSSSS